MEEEIAYIAASTFSQELKDTTRYKASDEKELQAQVGEAHRIRRRPANSCRLWIDFWKRLLRAVFKNSLDTIVSPAEHRSSLKVTTAYVLKHFINVRSNR